MLFYVFLGSNCLESVYAGLLFDDSYGVSGMVVWNEAPSRSMGAAGHGAFAVRIACFVICDGRGALYTGIFS